MKLNIFILIAVIFGMSIVPIEKKDISPSYLERKIKSCEYRLEKTYVEDIYYGSKTSNFEFKGINKKDNFNSMNTSFKAFMDYRRITDKKSKQWELQQLAFTDKKGLRKIGEYYCVALGTFYSQNCGETFLITLENAQIIPVIVADIKADIHTDKSNRYTILKNQEKKIYDKQGRLMINVVEFIVDTKVLPKEIKKLGTVSKLGLQGNITEIKEVEVK